MGVARRCSMCSLNWPHSDQFKVCPVCEDGTDPIKDVQPMDADEAAELKRNADFDRFYEKWDSEQDPDRLVPGEDEARFDAH